ncbi:MAG TPA: dihydrofolate reductase family protein [Thermoplasmata archaeon]|nr:dihydrofolate reductase family protein [Thermoplasmata archaeon]
MRVSVFVGTSLDGFIARENGSLDFLELATDEDYGYQAFLKSVDAVILGRKTYETVLAYPEWPYGDRPVVVMSTTLHDARGPEGSRCEIMNRTPTEVLSQLDHRGARHVYVDGGLTIQRFLRDGLVHDLTINRCPVLLGAGVPLFGSLFRDVRLQHVWTRTFPSGFVQSEYRVLP